MIKLGRVEFKLLETRDNEYVKSIIEETEYVSFLIKKYFKNAIFLIELQSYSFQKRKNQKNLQNLFGR